MGTKYISFKDLKFEPHPTQHREHPDAKQARVRLPHDTYASIVTEVLNGIVFKNRFNVALYRRNTEPIYKNFRTPQQVSYLLRRFQKQNEAAAQKPS